MKLKNVLPMMAMLLILLMPGCKNDQATDQATVMPLVLKAAPVGSPVATHGQVYVSGKNMKDAGGATMNLRGQSYGWSTWWPQYWNANVVSWMASDFKVDILRASMGVDTSPGYLNDATNQKNLVKTVVDAAIANGIYVLIDWHCEAFHQAEAVTFFSEMAQTYGSNPNVIYEILNEPTTQTWGEVKTYAAAIIAAIRQYDPDNIIVVGCPQWDQVIRQVADAPLTGYSNIMYTTHFYAASHGQWLRDDCAYAVGKNIPIFVTECSGMDASGSGAINYTEWEAWFTFMEANKISWCNWSISDAAGQSCSILLPGAPSNGGWTSGQLNESGNYIRTKIRSFAGGTPPANKLLNPGFETTANWTIQSPFSRSTTDKHAGSYSLKLVGTGSWTNTFQTISVTANTAYTFNVYIKGTANVYMCVYKSDWTATIASATKTPTSGWVKYTLSFNSGNNTQLLFDIQDAGAGTSYIDDAEVL